MTSVPTLRRKIFKAFSIILFLYAIFGTFLVVSVFLAGSTTPRMIHINYDSIAAAIQMQRSWDALNSDRYSEQPRGHWMDQFEKAIQFEEGNITEPGEKEIALGLRKAWDEYKNEIQKEAQKEPHFASLAQFVRMNQLLADLIQLNEKGMFELSEENASLSRRVLWGAMIYFFVTLVLSLVIADGLATRLSRPLKNIAEALQRRPTIGRRLKLLEPTSLEILILSNELQDLWKRVIESKKVNVMELRQQKSKLETVLESVEDALLVIEDNGRISHCNTLLSAFFGLSIDQIRGQIWKDLPSTHENYLKLRVLIREDMSDAQEVELLLNGTPHQFSARTREIVSPTGEVTATLVLLHDITEKKQRDRYRSEFIDLLSHEIKTPLQSLGTASEFLTSHRGELPESVFLFVDTISEDVERIRAVVNEFVQVTQTHSKLMKLRFDLVALNQTLPEWIKPFYVVAKDRSVQLEFRQEGSPIVWSSLDTVKFPWVISNLLSNAIRFSPENGKVEVVLTDRNGSVEIQVRDDGPGISEDDQRMMFEPFYQSPMITTTGRKGLFGIGLTIAKEVVEAHEGRIEYYARKPHGSEFRILLPFPPQNYG